MREDEEPDTSCIRIWYEFDEIGVVVYDDGMSQAIGDGSTAVHMEK